MVSASIDRFRFGEFTLDGTRASLSRGGRDVGLRPKPFEMLRFLLANADRLVTKDELLAAIWPKTLVTEDSLTRCISEVRAALGELGPQAIRTLPKRGYMFVLPVTRLPADAAPPGLVPLRATLRTNLPAQMQPLIGRDGDLLKLSELVLQRRLITLVGPGGVGKSRLAQRLLHDRRADFEHGVSWVDLSALTDLALVVSGIAAALGVNAVVGEPLNALLAALRPLQMLVVLDNAEHLVGVVSQVVQAMHDTAPGLRLIVTSQVPVNLAVETVYRLNTLEVPQSTTPIDAAMHYGAVALFAQRAQAADTRFVLTADNIGIAIEICRRLDGLPLAIELAAARAPFLGLHVLAAVLDERFRALTGGLRGAPERHQTLRAAMEWSHSLLSDTEKSVLHRLGVFANSFSLASAQRVIADSRLDEWSVLDALSALVDRSLLSVDRFEPVRYRLLETTRSFAVERLHESGETETLRHRHALACRQYFEEAYTDCFHGGQAVDRWRAAVIPALDDGRAACAWALNNDPETAVSLAASLAHVVSSERPLDRRRLLESTRPLVTNAMPAPLRACWNLEAAIDWSASHPALARRHAMHAVGLFKDLGDRVGLCRALSILISCDMGEPDYGLQAEFDELLAIEDPGWPAVLRAQSAQAMACWFSARGKFEAAIEWRLRAHSLYEQAGWSWQVLVAKANLMDSLLADGRVDDVIACGVELQIQLHETRQLSALPAARLNLAAALLFKSESAQARQIAVEGWSQALQLGWQPYWADYLALLAAIEGRPQSAGRLLGYANARYAANSGAREVNEARAAQRAERLVIDRIGALEFHCCTAAGAKLRDDEIAELAFGMLDLP